MKFKESVLAHKYLDNLTGIEIGGSAHNPFNLPRCINVDYTDDMDTIFKNEELRLCGEKLKVDVIADGANLPFPDSSFDYVISSHVIEHFFDPISALNEWFRVIRPGGYVFIIAPTKAAVPEETRPCTTVQELRDRYSGKIKQNENDHPHGHFSVWNLPDFLELCAFLGLNVIESLQPDDKVGNGFCVVIQVPQ